MRFLKLALFSALILSTQAMADSTASAVQTSEADSSFMSKVGKNIRASYLMWLTGPNTQAPSGNTSGEGMNLEILHIATLGYKLPANLSISLSQPFTQTIDEKPSSDVKPFVSNDPYLTFSHSKLISNERIGFSMPGYIRYYAPLSEPTIDAANVYKTTEAGRGAVRTVITPTKTFMDGALTFSTAFLFQYRISQYTSSERAAGSPTGSSKRENYFFSVTPGLEYQLSQKLSLAGEYSTGRIRHSTNNKWTNLTAMDAYGQYVSLGVNWSATKKLAMNPYLSVGPKFRGIQNTDIGLIATYTFL